MSTIPDRPELAGSCGPFLSGPVIHVSAPSEELARQLGRSQHLGLAVWPPVDRGVRISEWLNLLTASGDDRERQ